MKLVVAVIPPDCLEAVHDALNRDEARVISAALATDDRFSAGMYRGGQVRVARARLRLEVLVVNDLAVADALDAISGVTGPNDGIACVSSVDELVRFPRVAAGPWSADEDPPRRESQGTPGARPSRH